MWPEFHNFHKPMGVVIVAMSTSYTQSMIGKYKIFFCYTKQYGSMGTGTHPKFQNATETPGWHYWCYNNVFLWVVVLIPWVVIQRADTLNLNQSHAIPQNYTTVFFSWTRPNVRLLNLIEKPGVWPHQQPHTGSKDMVVTVSVSVSFIRTDK